MSEYAIGIDLGGTFIKSGVVDASGAIVAQVSRPTGVEDGADAVVGRMAEAADEARREAGLSWEQTRAVGVGSPGVIDLKNGVVLICPNIPCVVGVCLPRAVGEAIGREGLSVVLENDANAAAYGEAWAGAGRDVDTLILMTLGTGIGGGIVLDGHIWHGAHGFAGELGHVTIEVDGEACPCGNRGCVERYASAAAMERRFREAVESGKPSTLADTIRDRGIATGREISEAAMAGDAAAREIIEETGRYLGVAATNVAHIFDPDMVVFAGGLTGAGDLLLDAIRREARSRMFEACRERVEIAFAELGNDAGLIGAAGWALKTSATSASGRGKGTG